MNKEDFIRNLESMSKEDINQFIKDKGKQPKLISPITIYSEEEYNKRRNEI